jgi:hypothetical protein
MIWLGPLSLLLALAHDLQLQTAEQERDEIVRQVVAHLTTVRLRFDAWMETAHGHEVLMAAHNNEPTQRFPDPVAVMNDAIGADFLGSGKTRIAFQVSRQGLRPGFVVKLAHNIHGSRRSGQEHNETEVALWRWAVANKDERRSAKELTELLVQPRLYANDFSWVVYDLAQPVPAGRYLPTPRPDDVDISRRLTQVGVTDVHRRNMGLVEGELRLLDYAQMKQGIGDRIQPERAALRAEIRRLGAKTYGQV